MAGSPLDKVFKAPAGVIEQRKKALLAYLRRHGDRAVPAIELADGPCQVRGSREYRRRAVRKLVEQLREDGYTICAGKQDAKAGYWLALSDSDWGAYKEAVKTGAVHRFCAVRRMAAASCERKTGQGTLGDWGRRNAQW